MIYYVLIPSSDYKWCPRHGNAKYPPVPLPWPTKNENIITDNADKAKVEGFYK